MPNKGKKTASRQANLGKKKHSKSGEEISRSFAKKDVNLTSASSQINQDDIDVDPAVSEKMVSRTKSAAVGNVTAAPLHPHLTGELLRIFATTGVIIAILIGLNFII